jgi:hypothetical protein
MDDFERTTEWKTNEFPCLGLRAGQAMAKQHSLGLPARQTDLKSSPLRPSPEWAAKG